MSRFTWHVHLGTGLWIYVGAAVALGAVLRHRMPSCAHVGAGLLGILPQVVAAMGDFTLHDFLKQIHDIAGNTVFLQFGLLKFFVTPIVFTRDPRNVQYMLKDNFNNYPKGETFSAITHDLLGSGIFNADGQSWSMQRKTASQMFTANRFKNHIWRVVEKNCGKVRCLLQEAVSKRGEVDMFNMFNRFTLDSIGEIGFGTSVGSLENASSPFLQSFDEAQRIVFWRFWIPGWRLLRLFGLGTESRGREHFKVLRNYSTEIIQDLAQKLDTDAGDSFVGLFMKSDSKLSEAFLVDMVLNFLIAGRDTTAQAMSWCLFLLMKQVDVQEKIRREIKEICGAEALNYDKLREFQFLEAVLKESLRLYPSVPLDTKLVARADTLPDGTYVPAGTFLVYNSYAMGRHQDIWGADASDFRPERWLDTEHVKSPYENPVFHAGPRECLGKRLAMLEMKAMLIHLFRNFRLRLAVPPDEVKPDVQLTIGMSSGLKCYVEPV
mmetsp:Transcript_37538/g.69971  ORF Transcript_37538/g.69971 Transcript_37538/m.69971 type:complete len:492 (+) Transcript_37538:40-1515(+)